MASLGTKESPLRQNEPMEIARAFILKTKEEGGAKGPALWLVGGTWLAWCGGMWEPRTQEQIERALWRWMDELWFCCGGKETSIQKLVPKKGVVADVMAALAAKCEAPWERTPVWVGVTGRPDPMECVAFEDVVLWVRPGAVEVVCARDETWLDVGGVPARWANREEGCPRWMQALEEWSCGDQKWKDLLQWFMGYCLLGKRGYAKWMLMQGKSRAGKGVIADVLKMLVGKGGWFETGMSELGGDFGLDGAECAKVLSLSEFHEAEPGLVSKVSRVLKNIVGEDGVTINAKYVRQTRRKVGAVPLIQANMMPRLPNESEGISSKMLVLPFTVGFRDAQGDRKPDYRLRERLKAEVAGIAAWAIAGAMALEQAEGLGWPEPDKGEMVRQGFRIKNNPLDAFLESKFAKDESGFVTADVLWREWLAWKKDNDVRVAMGRAFLPMRLEQESTWKVERMRKRVMRDGKPEQVRGLKGLGLLKVGEGML
jgi:putative DNA primase/helicase